MSEPGDDPTMPARPPIASKAVEQIRSFRSWEPVEMYRAIRDALQEPHEYPPERRFSGGRPPSQ